MIRIELRKVIRRNKATLRALGTAIDTPFHVENTDGKVLFGDATEGDSYEVAIDGVVLGAVVGPAACEGVAAVLSALVRREQEKKQLAAETLDRYKELTLLYEVSHRLSAVLELEGVARLLLEEAQRHLAATGGAVLLIDPRSGDLEVVAATGSEFQSGRRFGATELGIATRVLQSGTAEVVEDTSADPVYVVADETVASLILSPMRSGENVIGLFRLSSDVQKRWTAGDLKLVNSLAAHAAAAIENSLLHRARLREQRLKSHLERYVSPRLLDAVLDDAPPNHSVHVAVLFADLRELSAQAVDLSPEQMVTGLDRWVGHTIEVLLSHGGTVNKLHGDMIVALFSDVDDEAGAAGRALQAAHGVIERLASLGAGALGLGITMTKVSTSLLGGGTDPNLFREEVNAAAALQAVASGRMLVDYRVRELTQSHGYRFEQTEAVRLAGGPMDVFEVAR